MFAFDKRLLESALAFGNGGDARDCFEWVEAKVKALATAAGFTSAEVDRLSWRDDYVHVGPDQLVWRLRATLAAASRQVSRKSLLDEKRQKTLDDWFTKNLGSMQIVSKWRVEDGELSEIPVPLVNTVDRCITYATGVYLLDRHGFRRSVKQCPFVADPLEDPWEQALHFHAPENIGRVPHWFLQFPLTKQRFCNDKHAAAFRQRKFREKP
jgi:hypothetical protein